MGLRFLAAWTALVGIAAAGSSALKINVRMPAEAESFYESPVAIITLPVWIDNLESKGGSFHLPVRRGSICDATDNDRRHVKAAVVFVNQVLGAQEVHRCSLPQDLSFTRIHSLTRAGFGPFAKLEGGDRIIHRVPLYGIAHHRHFNPDLSRCNLTGVLKRQVISQDRIWLADPEVAAARDVWRNPRPILGGHHLQLAAGRANLLLPLPPRPRLNDGRNGHDENTDARDPKGGPVVGVTLCVFGALAVGWGLWGLIMTWPVGAARAARHGLAVMAGRTAVVVGGLLTPLSVVQS